MEQLNQQERHRRTSYYLEKRFTFTNLFQGNRPAFMDDNSVKIVFLPSLLRVGAKSSLLGLIPFHKGHGVQESRKEVTKVRVYNKSYPLYITAENLSNIHILRLFIRSSSSQLHER